MATGVWAAVRRDLAMIARHLPARVSLNRDQALLWISGGPTADFNMGFVESARDEAAMLHEFVAQVRSAGVQALFMLSSACGARVASIAREVGVSQVGTAPLMLLQAPDQSATSGKFTVRHETDPASFGTVADLIAAAFGLDREWVERTFAAPSLLAAPEVRCFVSADAGEPVSTLTTTLTGDGPVGIWNMATAPDRQRQGAGRAVLASAIHQHQLEGHNSFYLIATPAGKPLYDNFGFQTVDDLVIWIIGESEQFTQH